MHRPTHHSLTLESLEDRLALSGTPVAANPLEAVVDLKASSQVATAYTEYVNFVQSGSQGAFNSSVSGQIVEVGSMVGIDVRFGSGNFLANAAQMQQLGMQITAGYPSQGVVEGLMPLGQLPSVAEDPNATYITPVVREVSYADPAPVTAVSLKGGPVLASIYQEYLNYQAAGSQGTFAPAESSQVVIQGTSVGVDIRTPVADFSAMLGQMQALGMQVTAVTTVGQVAVIEGLVPIAQLPTVAENSMLVGVAPVYYPTRFGAF